MALPECDSASLNIQLFVDSIPALITTASPDGCLDYFNKPWLEYLGATLDHLIGWERTAFVHPEDVRGWWTQQQKNDLVEYLKSL
jgi:PAS domain-containing protein